MQHPESGAFILGDSEADLRAIQEKELAAMSPKKRSTLEDDRNWPIMRVGETVTVTNSSGVAAKCVIESIGRKFMRVRGIPRY